MTSEYEYRPPDERLDDAADNLQRCFTLPLDDVQADDFAAMLARLDEAAGRA